MCKKPRNPKRSSWGVVGGESTPWRGNRGVTTKLKFVTFGKYLVNDLVLASLTSLQHTALEGKWDDVRTHTP